MVQWDGLAQELEAQRRVDEDKRRFLKFIGATGVAGLTGLAGCGGSGSETGTEAPTHEDTPGSPETTETTVEPDTETPTPTETRYSARPFDGYLWEKVNEDGVVTDTEKRLLEQAEELEDPYVEEMIYAFEQGEGDHAVRTIQVMERKDLNGSQMLNRSRADSFEAVIRRDDQDRDGVDDLDEIDNETDLGSRDTEGDGFGDLLEILNGWLHPLYGDTKKYNRIVNATEIEDGELITAEHNLTDSDRNDIFDRVEVAYGWNATGPGDNDHFPDIDELRFDADGKITWNGNEAEYREGNVHGDPGKVTFHILQGNHEDVKFDSLLGYPQEIAKEWGKLMQRSNELQEVVIEQGPAPREVFRDTGTKEDREERWNSYLERSKYSEQESLPGIALHVNPYELMPTGGWAFSQFPLAVVEEPTLDENGEPDDAALQNYRQSYLAEAVAAYIDQDVDFSPSLWDKSAINKLDKRLTD